MLSMAERCELARAMGQTIWKCDRTDGKGGVEQMPDETLLDPDRDPADAMAVLTWILDQGYYVSCLEKAPKVGIWLDKSSALDLEIQVIAEEVATTAQELRDVIGQAGLEVARRIRPQEAGK